MENKIIKVGCSITMVDEKARSAYEAYLAAHLPPEPKKETPAAQPAPAPEAKPEGGAKTETPADLV